MVTLTLLVTPTGQHLHVTAVQNMVNLDIQMIIVKGISGTKANIGPCIAHILTTTGTLSI